MVKEGRKKKKKYKGRKIYTLYNLRLDVVSINNVYGYINSIETARITYTENVLRHEEIEKFK